MIVCRNCQTRLSDETKFCTMCGIRIGGDYQTGTPEVILGLSKRLTVSMVLWIIASCWFSFVIIFSWEWLGVLLGGKLILLHFGMAMDRHEKSRKILSDYSEIIEYGNESFDITKGIIIGIVIIEVIAWFWIKTINYLLLLSIVLGLIDFLMVNLYVKIHRKKFLELELFQRKYKTESECEEKDNVGM